MSQALYEQAAFHESGHIIVAYIADFACTGVSLNSTTPGEAWTRMDYGEETLLATALLKSDTHPQIFNALPLEVKVQCPGLAHRLFHMLCGGPVAEALHKNGVGFRGKLEIEMQGPDLQMVLAIDSFLARVPQYQKAQGYAQKSLGEVVNALRTDEIWNAVMVMARSILAAPNRTMNRGQIEDVLTQCGFLDLLEAQRQGKN